METILQSSQQHQVLQIQLLLYCHRVAERDLFPFIPQTPLGSGEAGFLNCPEIINSTWFQMASLSKLSSIESPVI